MKGCKEESRLIVPVMGDEIISVEYLLKENRFIKKEMSLLRK